MERPLTEHIRPGEPPRDLRSYERDGGYRAARKALTELTRAQIIAEVKASTLRGRGGAGFATGTKWSLVPASADRPGPRYFVVNADEMEPGTFKDRYLLEGDPHQLLEGLIIGAYAVQAERAYIFLRWAYRLAVKRLQQALAEAYQAGYLGDHIFGTAERLDIHLHVSAGRYMCGEETGLLNVLEGRRATPRAKPPYPPVSGLAGRPTVVQNVETLCNVPHIINNGAEWFRGLSRGGPGNGGTKLYGVSGRVKRPGLWELPMGTTIRELLEEHAGGMQEGYRLRGLIPGGASTDFLVEEHLDVKLDFEAVVAAGSRLGTGTMIVLDDRTCPVGMVHNLERFFARESCGWCTPCREGLPWVVRLLHALEQGEGLSHDPELLAQHCRFLGPGYTFCALAPGAVEPLQSALRYFADDFARHIEGHGCPWRAS